MKIKKELRRWAMLALVLVLLFSHTVGANASTGAPDVTVGTYEELVSAIQGASNLDTILITGVIEVPEGSQLGYISKIVILKSSKGYIKVLSNSEATEPTRISNIIFDGANLDLLSPYIAVKGNIEVTGCTFKNCGNFGAVNLGYSDGVFSNCTFKDNKGSYGAHLSVGYQATVSITGCSFTGGLSTNRGGGIYLDNSASTATISNCVITGNTGSYGGGIANWGNVTVTNTLLYGNTASVGGADLFSVGSYTLDSVDDMAELFHDEGLDPLSWDSDYTDLDYGATALKLRYTTYEAPKPTDPPVEPEPTDPPVEPTDPDKGDGTDGEDPTTPPEGEKPTDPTTPPNKDPVDPEPTPSTPSDTEQGGNIDNSTTDNSTTDNSDHSTADNSHHSSTIDNSSNVSNVDNSSQVSSTDNSRSESSKTKNSNNTTTYYYYQTEQDKSSTGASHSPLQPISVNVTVPQDKEAGKGSQELTGANQNIYIEAEGVNVRYEYTADGVSISISPYKATESSKEVNVVPTSLSTVSMPQEPEKSPNSWVDYVCMILLAILVLGELRDRFRLKKGA